MDVQDWQRIARQELERRATSIVQALDDAILEAIAAGTLDMHIPTHGDRSITFMPIT
ncbi:hypothetical protein [Pseudomonas aeruginosa]|uniref:hypothetical protein n=1 Tax=Pseudomonas aeruginosa TaxID=287 RepID=UPI0021C5DC9E|nr:hypothetical protein [Pseudomonas aeruginosa]